jgi:hypothetical protein
MPEVTGYIFESFDIKRAKAFNFFLQLWDVTFVMIKKNGVSTFMMIEGDEEDMCALCTLLNENPKILITTEVDEIVEINF